MRSDSFRLTYSIIRNDQIAGWTPTIIKTICYVPIVVFDAYCIHSRIDGQHASYKTRTKDIVGIAQIYPYVPYNTFFIISLVKSIAFPQNISMGIFQALWRRHLNAVHI